MYGVTFGDKHTIDDYGLVMTDYDTGQPEPKRFLVDVPGKNGTLDLTGQLTPNIAYGNRQLQFAFVWRSRPEDFEEELKAIVNDLHGKRMHVILDSDPDYYYDGFVTVESKSFSGREKGAVVISVDADPFKREIYQTVKQRTGNGTLTCYCDRMEVTPTIENSAAATIVFGNLSVSLSAGTHVVSSIVFSEGENTLTITCTGTTKVTYRNGRL